MLSARIRNTLASCFLASMLACSGSATQLVVVVDSDLEVGTDITQVSVQIQSAEYQPKWKYEFDIMDEQSLPFSFGVEGSSGDANALHIEAHAISSDDTSRTSRRAVVSLIDGKSLILNLELLQECATVQCGSDKTCLPSGGQGACGSAFVNSNTLEEQMN